MGFKPGYQGFLDFAGTVGLGLESFQRLARRFEEVERRVRAAVAEAPEGDRRELLRQSLLLLAALRRLDPGSAVIAAYLAAFRAVRRGGDGQRVSHLASALAGKLDRGVLRAQEGSQAAFRAVTADTVEDAAHDAVTAYVDDAGKRWTLGGYAGMLGATIGRQATSLGTVDAAGDSFVVVDGTSDDSICGPLIGWRGPATDAPLPPFHHGCVCLLESA